MALIGPTSMTCALTYLRQIVRGNGNNQVNKYRSKVTEEVSEWF